MDSTPPSQSPIQPNNPLSASKLPIKRRSPDSDPHLHAPPFKFHRIWTEPDEITFLQGLLDSSSRDLAFPRDLGLFYARFSATMSQPYTKSQLSEKLRRLRKKFWLISSRLSNGLDRSHLSLHDQALFDLSKRLWHPDFSATSPFSGVRNQGNNCNAVIVDGDHADHGDGEFDKSALVGIRVNFSPNLSTTVSDHAIAGNHFNLGVDKDCLRNKIRYGGFPIRTFCNEGGDRGEAKLSEVNVEFERAEEMTIEDDKNGTFNSSEKVVAGKSIYLGRENQIRAVMTKVVLNVFDDCFKDVRRRLVSQKAVAGSFHMRWQRQRIAELDVLGSRLRLVVENSLGKH